VGEGCRLTQPAVRPHDGLHIQRSRHRPCPARCRPCRCWPTRRASMTLARPGCWPSRPSPYPGQVRLGRSRARSHLPSRLLIQLADLNRAGLAVPKPRRLLRRWCALVQLAAGSQGHGRRTASCGVLCVMDQRAVE
jgi:hypothetical protein